MAQGTVETAFVRCLYQMEMERIKYILQSYFRTRILKIQRYADHLKQMSGSELVAILSKCEMEHLVTYRRIIDAALRESVLNALPGPLRTYPDYEETGTVVQAPNLNAHVMARFNKAIPELVIDPDAQTVETNVEPGDMYVLKYAAVKDLVGNHTVDLL